MLIAKIEGTQITVGDYRALFPTVAFTVNGPDDAFLQANGCKRVNLWKAHDALTEMLAPAAPYEEGDWVYTVAVRPMTAEEVQAAKNSAMANLRAQRNRLLAECDWTQLADSPVDKTVWGAYRQALRDLPANVQDPRIFNDWPVRPDQQQEEQ